MSGASYRVDETYIKVGKSCKYLYRAVDKEGNTIEFMLGAKRDVLAAKRFFKKMMRAEHRRLPFSISVDKNAAYPEAFSTSQDEYIMPKGCTLRRDKGSVAKIIFKRERSLAALPQAATWKSEATNFACPCPSLPANLLTCPFLIMLIASMPSRVRSAVWNDLKH